MRLPVIYKGYNKEISMLNKVLDFIEKYVTAVLFAAMCAIIIIQIVFRFAHMDVSWCEELARYLCVWVIYLAGSKAVKDGKHLTVDILPLFMKEKNQRILNIFSTVATLCFFAALLYAGSLILPTMIARPQYSPGNGINMIIPYLAPTVGTVLMTLRSIGVIIDDVRDIRRLSKGEVA